MLKIKDKAQYSLSVGEILDFTLLSINICSNRNSSRILYCPLKSGLKYSVVKDYDTIIQTSRYLSYKYSKNHIFPKSQYIFYRQFQNTGNKIKYWIQKEWKFPNSSFTGNSKFNIVTTFFQKQIFYQFSTKRVPGCLAWKKSRALGDGNMMKFL